MLFLYCTCWFILSSFSSLLSSSIYLELWDGVFCSQYGEDIEAWKSYCIRLGTSYGSFFFSLSLGGARKQWVCSLSITVMGDPCPSSRLGPGSWSAMVTSSDSDMSAIGHWLLNQTVFTPVLIVLSYKPFTYLRSTYSWSPLLCLPDHLAACNSDYFKVFSCLQVSWEFNAKLVFVFNKFLDGCVTVFNLHVPSVHLLASLS